MCASVVETNRFTTNSWQVQFIHFPSLGTLMDKKLFSTVFCAETVMLASSVSVIAKIFFIAEWCYSFRMFFSLNLLA